MSESVLSTSLNPQYFAYTTAPARTGTAALSYLYRVAVYHPFHSQFVRCVFPEQRKTATSNSLKLSSLYFIVQALGAARSAATTCLYL